MHRAVLPIYESASIMWSFARPGQSRKGTDSRHLIIPEAEPKARLSGTS